MVEMMEDKYPQDFNNSLNLKRYFQIIVQHKWLGLIVGSLVATLVVLYALRMPAIYESSFNIYYNPDSHTELSSDEAVAYTQPELSYWKKTMVSMRIYDMTLDHAGLAYSPAQLSKMFSVNNGRDENLFSINLKVRNPETVPILAESYLHSLNVLDENNKSEHYVRKFKYLNGEIASNRNAIDSCDLSIMHLSNKLNLQNIESVDQLNNIRENFKKDLKLTEVELSYVRASKAKTENELANLNDTLFEKSSFTEPLKVQLMNLHVDLARALTKYGEEHPTVKGIRNNIEHVQEMLTDGYEQNIVIKDITANPIKRDLLGQLIQLKINEISLEAKIHSLEGIISTTNTTSTPNQELYQLLRRRETLLTNSDFLHKKIIDMEMTMKGITSSFHMIDEPAVPVNGSDSRKKILYILAMMMGIISAIAVIILYDMIDDRIKLVEDFSNFFNVTILGAVRHRSGKDLLLKFRTQDPKMVYEEYENELTDIRVNLKQLLGENLHSTYSVISPLRKDGKSLIIYLLALEYASIGKKVLIMDFDIYGPKISQQFNKESLAGVQDYLLSDAAFNEIVQETDIPGLSIAPLGQNPYNVKLLFDTEKVDELINEAREAYDMVFIDTPALLISPAINGLLGHIDHSIMVTRIGHTSRKNTQMVLEKISKGKSHFVGTILSDMKPIPMGTYYDKYKKYRKYYYYDKNNQEPEPSKKWNKGKTIVTSAISLLMVSGIIFSLLHFFPEVLKGKGKAVEEFYETADISLEKFQKEVDSIEELTKLEEKQAGSIYIADAETVEIKDLDFEEEAVVKTQVESKVETAANSEPPADLNNPGEAYYIIAGCFSTKENADKLQNKLLSEGYDAEYYGKLKGLHTICIGSSSSKDAALSKLETARQALGDGIWLYKMPVKAN